MATGPSDKYIRYTQRRLDCHDRLPPAVREAVRGAHYDFHNPVELLEAAYVVKTPVLVNNILQLDELKRRERQVSLVRKKP